MAMALVRAAERGDVAEVECLLDRGANIEARDENGNTPPVAAAGNGHREVVECLLDRGADIEAYIEARRGRGGRTALIAAAREGHGEVVECLLDRGADIEGQGEHGRTALITAAWYGHRDVVECLLDGYPKWAGVSAEIQYLISIICLKVAAVADHGECCVLGAPGGATGVGSHLLRVGPRKNQCAMVQSSQPNLLVMNEVEQ
jgi:ankyrin repeat protein